MGKPLKYLILFLHMIALSACSSGPEKRATEDESFISVRARNHLASENPEGLVRVGEGFEKSGNYQSALNLYGQAMAAAPALIDAQIAYARVLSRVGAFDKSVHMLATLLEENPHNVNVRRTMVNTYVREREYAAARLFLAPLFSNPQVSPSISDQIIMGKLSWIEGHKAEAKEHFNSALEQDKSNTEALLYVGYAFALEENYETAVAMIQKAMDSPATSQQAHSALALVYALSGQLGAAMQITRHTTSTENATAKRLFFQSLPSFTDAEKGEALMFSVIDNAAIVRVRSGAIK